MDTILGADEPGAEALVKDATIDSFEVDVITESMTRPVIVDFWAEWCGPCKQLAPALEKGCSRRGGKSGSCKKLISTKPNARVPTSYTINPDRICLFPGATN